MRWLGGMGIVVAACGGGGASEDGAGAPAGAAPSAAATSTAGAPPPASTSGGAPPPTPPPAASGCNAAGVAAGDVDWTLMTSSGQRVAHVHVPKSYDKTKPTPIVLDFHGYYETGTLEASMNGMNAKADAAGFVAVHPDGLSQSWNAGACCGSSAQSNVDDVGFVNALVDLLETKLCVDTKRVFVTGMSNGGFLSHRLACELAGRIAAIAPVAGVLGVPTCKPSRPVPVMQFHGTSDPLVPWDGNPSIAYPSVPDTMSAWAMRDACAATTHTTYQNGDVTCSAWDACTADVVLCKVDGGGHQWPGGVPIPSLGKTTNDIKATDAMWDFFQKHPMP